MEKVVLKATKRNVSGKQVKVLRREGQLPGVIYGRHTEPINISLEAHSASIALAKLTSSSLVTIDVDGTEYPVLVREKQRNYIKGSLLHIDFLTVSLDEKIRANIRVELVGVSPAVKDFNAVLVHGIQALHVECFPGDLPERITVDIAALKQVGQGLHVSDIHVSDKIRILNNPDDMIAVATMSKDEESKAGEGGVPAAEAAQPELSVDRGKKDEEAAGDKKK
jgi:large subunit ribosomal protein L25